MTQCALRSVRVFRLLKLHWALYRRRRNKCWFHPVWLICSLDSIPVNRRRNQHDVKSQAKCISSCARNGVIKWESFQHTPVFLMQLQKIYHTLMIWSKKCESFQYTPVLVIELQKVSHPVPGLVVKKYESFQHTPVFLMKLQKVFHPMPGLVVKKRESFQHTCFPHEVANSISSCARTGGQKAWVVPTYLFSSLSWSCHLSSPVRVTLSYHSTLEPGSCWWLSSVSSCTKPLRASTWLSWNNLFPKFTQIWRGINTVSIWKQFY